MLLLRAEVATPELPEKLQELGAIVDDVACYKTLPERRTATARPAACCKTAPTGSPLPAAPGVENFNVRFNLKELLTRFPRIQLATIGPETSKAVVALGLRPALEAKEHTIAGLVKAPSKSRRGPDPTLSMKDVTFLGRPFKTFLPVDTLP